MPHETRDYFTAEDWHRSYGSCLIQIGEEGRKGRVGEGNGSQTGNSWGGVKKEKVDQIEKGERGKSENRERAKSE